MIHLDTHIFAALHDGEPVQMSRRAARLLGAETPFISPLVLFEIELVKHRTHIANARDAFALLNARLGLELVRTPLAEVVDEAMTIAWTREPMDRLIVANAMVEGARLITADSRIRSNFEGALW